jgi:hypothetical protein
MLFEAIGMTIGKTNVLQSSSELTNWFSIATNVALAGSIKFTNWVAPGQKFFRLLEVP